jgi:2-dehydro-3-deoxyphosphogluconate aldolase/(4S)-4-hydroxy-2-oxoglutarate aldolase
MELSRGSRTRAPKEAAMSETQIMIADSPISNSAMVVGISHTSRTAELTREAVVEVIEKIGVIPALRRGAVPDLLFAAETLAEGGIPVIEVSMSEPGAVDLIARLNRRSDKILVGAGSVFNAEMARRSLDAGAKFLVSDICAPEIVELAARESAAVILGALTPTEVMAAWSAGADFVKVTPCGANEHDYIRAVKAMMPEVRLVAAGAITQYTALNFVKAGASALSASTDLVQPEAVRLRQANRIREMARRFLNAVSAGRETLD